MPMRQMFKLSSEKLAAFAIILPARFMEIVFKGMEEDVSKAE